jgi:hypothetical protein
MSAEQAASWHGLLDLHERVPTGWTLVGGQLVHLHCAERDHHPERPTDDIDAVVDVRAAADMLHTFTLALRDLGFRPDTSGTGLQHRWRRDSAQIDVLLPDGVGERAAARPGAGGAPTLPTPGGTQALARSEAVRVDLDGRVGTVHRPHLVGALVMKAAAHTTADAGRARHRLDFVTLAALVGRDDFRTVQLTNKDRKRLGDMLAACEADPLALEPGHAASSLQRLRRAAGLG